MLSMEEKALYECFKKEIESEVSIVYKKEAGTDGKTTLSASGSGPMLFDAICTILKNIAQAEGKQMGNPQAAEEYVNLVCGMVLEDLKEGIEMDGVLGRIGTDHIPEPGSRMPESVRGKRTARAADLRPGQAIRFEFGAPDNWIRLEIREVHIFEKQVTLNGKGNGYQDDYSFQPDELVEVLDGR